MINPTEVIEITTTGYLSQFALSDCKYYNSDFFITPARLKGIYIIKYIGKNRQFARNPFKVMKL